VAKERTNLGRVHVCPICDFHSMERYSRCPQCRANVYLEFKLKVDPSTFRACKDCMARTGLNEIQNCARCMRAKGLRICKKCKAVCTLGQDMFPRRALCRDCDAGLRRARRRKA
jgi:hypothetical protein